MINFDSILNKVYVRIHIIFALYYGETQDTNYIEIHLLS